MLAKCALHPRIRSSQRRLCTETHLACPFPSPLLLLRGNLMSILDKDEERFGGGPEEGPITTLTLPSPTPPRRSPPRTRPRLPGWSSRGCGYGRRPTPPARPPRARGSAKARPIHHRPGEGRARARRPPPLVPRHRGRAETALTGAG